MWDNVKGKNLRLFRSAFRILAGAGLLPEAGPVLARYTGIEETMSTTYTEPDLIVDGTPSEERPSGKQPHPSHRSRNRFAIAFRLLTATLGFFLSCQALVLVRYWEDHRYLQSLAARVMDPSTPPSEQTKQILTYFKGKPRRTNTSYFLLPFFDFLRPTARQVAEQGGDCADRSRLTLILLQLHNIPAEKWTLYSAAGRAKHSVVEVNTEQGKMVADPLFGLFFPRPEGGYYSISDLRGNPDLVRERVIEMEAHHQEPLAAQIERYPVSVYTYQYAKTMNWDKSPLTRFVYRGLRAIFGKRVDDLRRPVWPEEPTLVVAAGLGFLEIAILLALFVLRRAAIRRGQPVWDQTRFLSSRSASSIPA